MPIYEYRCSDCGKKTQLLTLSVKSAVEPKCRHCGGLNLQKLVSRIAVLRSEESRLESMADTSALSGLDENDPKSVARWMKKMGSEMGEDMPPEFNEYCSRLEAGEDPDKLEEELGGAMGGEGDYGGGDDTLYE
jgi:putative FmdB family regulatory protein